MTALLLTACLALTACTGDDPDPEPAAGSPGTSTSGSVPPSSPSTGLIDPSRCGDGFTCATLEVPLDRSAPDHGSLPLQVAAETTTDADRGLLLVLAGGPGQAGVPLIERLVETLGSDVVDAYRIAVIDQRGTGATALECPALQRAMGFSDLTPPPAAAVRSCARTVGDDREFYSTDDVVADLDQLRAVLGAERMTLYGTSYGTFVAEQYALAHPDQTEALVLDSVVPHDGIDPLSVDVMQAVRRVLRDACTVTDCPADPVDDLATVIAREHNGVDLLDLTTMVSIVDPSFERLIDAVHLAAQGSTDALEELLEGYRHGFQGPADTAQPGPARQRAVLGLDIPVGDLGGAAGGSRGRGGRRRRRAVGRRYRTVRRGHRARQRLRPPVPAVAAGPGRRPAPQRRPAGRAHPAAGRDP